MSSFQSSFDPLSMQMYMSTLNNMSEDAVKKYKIWYINSVIEKYSSIKKLLIAFSVIIALLSILMMKTIYEMYEISERLKSNSHHIELSLIILIVIMNATLPVAIKSVIAALNKKVQNAAAIWEIPISELNKI